MLNGKGKWRRILATGVMAALLVSGVNMITLNSVEAKATPQFFDFEAHRGGRDARPENTLVAFAYAMELGVTTLEMDMQMT